jgi:hypothetical protein
VISSPIHMITAVPDTIVTTMVRMVSGVGCGISGWDAGPQLLPGNAAPVLAACTYTTAYSSPRPTVTYLVYWVIFAWPAWPSFRCSSELRLSRFKTAKTPLELDVPEQ